MTTVTSSTVTTDVDRRWEEGATVLVDKPAGVTSFDVVRAVRRILRVRKVGHAGTLDPMATGLLILCTGKRTREIDRYAGLEKEYEGSMILGGRTESFDTETPVYEHRSVDGITDERVQDVIRSFVGTQTQLPPMWSAVKVKGRRLYAYARKGLTVERKQREIVIHVFQVRSIRMPEVAFTVCCSKGTYIRSLVEDIGLALGCGAYLTSLRRTRIGPYTVREATTMEILRAQSSLHQAEAR